MFIRLSPLKNRDYRLLYIGQLVSFFGSMITYVAIPYQIYEITKSSFQVGLLGSVQLVPLLVTALWGGAYADVLDRRKLLVWSEILMAVCSLALALNAAQEAPSVVLIFVLSALMSAINGFHRPALDALTPQLVSKEELPAIATLGMLRFNLGAIGGPAVAGIILAKFGVLSTYLLDAFTFAISVVALFRMRPRAVTAIKEKVTVESIKEGMRYAKKRSELVGTYLVDIIAMIFAMPMALFPALAEQYGGASAAGWLYSSMALGSLVFALFSGWTNKVKRHGAAVILAATAWGVAIVFLGFATSLFWAVVCLALAGTADTISGVYRQTIWNETVPTSLRGRLAGIEMLSYMSGPLLGNLRAGYVASVSSNFVSILSGGILCVIGTLACVLFLPEFWKYRSESPSS